MRTTIINQYTCTGVAVDVFQLARGTDGAGTGGEKTINVRTSGHFVLKNKRQYFLLAQKPETRDH